MRKKELEEKIDRLEEAISCLRLCKEGTICKYYNVSIDGNDGKKFMDLKREMRGSDFMKDILID